MSPITSVVPALEPATWVLLATYLIVAVAAFARGGRWAESIGQHWRLAIYVFLGSLFGTQLLVGLPTDPLKLGLALMIVVSLNINRIKRLDWQRLLAQVALG